MDFNIDLLETVLRDLRDGVSVADAQVEGFPLIYVNPAFEKMTGYEKGEILGKSCSFLQGQENHQPERKMISDTLSSGSSCLVTLRNYHKNGRMFWNELSLSPVRNETGNIQFYVGIQKDVTHRVMLEQKANKKFVEMEQRSNSLKMMAITDPLTGLYNRRYFDLQLSVHWNMAQRHHHNIALFMIDVDNFKAYNDTYGHQSGDVCLRTIGKAIGKTFRRGTDFSARYGGEEFVVLSTGVGFEQAEDYAQRLREKILSLKVPHAGNDTGLVTISIGFAVTAPDVDDNSQALLSAADSALYAAKEKGRNCVVQGKIGCQLTG